MSNRSPEYTYQLGFSDKELQESDPYCNQEIDVVLAFEGGGAKGIAHLAALYEIEASNNDFLRQGSPYRHWPRYKIRGASGTSIGALFALFVALDFRAKEILSLPALRLLIRERAGTFRHRIKRFGLRTKYANPKPSLSHALAQAKLDTDLTKIFGKVELRWLKFIPGWHIVWIIRFISKHPIISLTLLIFSTTLVYSLVVSQAIEIIPLSDPANKYVSVVAVSFLVVLAALYFSRIAASGFCSADTLIYSLNNLIVHRLNQFKANKEGDLTRDPNRNLTTKPLTSRRWARFSEVGQIKPLRVVSTDIHYQKMALWSEVTTPHIPVAKAVAASMALPIIFRPIEIYGSLHCDGGLTSNLPAWTFDAETKFYPDCFTLAFETDDTKDKDSPRIPFRQPFRDFVSLFRATAFGARELELRGARRFVVAVPTKNVGLLDFDMTAESLLEKIGDHRAFIRQAIDDRVFWRQLNFDACRKIHDETMAALSDSPLFTQNQNDWRVRVAIMQPDEAAPRSLKTAYAYNFGEIQHSRKKKVMEQADDPRLSWDVDDRITIPIQGSVSGAAFVTRHCRWFVNNEDDPQYHDDLAMMVAEHRYRNPLHWKNRKWIFAVPIFYGMRSNPNAKVLRVVTLDGNMDINMEKKETESTSSYGSLSDDEKREATLEIKRDLDNLKDKIRKSCEEAYKNIDYYCKERYKPNGI